MKAKLIVYKNQILETWQGLSKRNQYLIVGALSLFIISIILIIYWSSKPNYVPLYNNLSAAEAGEIVSAIEAQGIPVELSPDGKTISVPKSEASRLKVELAHQGIPRSGNINYGIFSENMGFGMTDKQFNVVERDAMQNELRYLIEQVNGISEAKVMITMPEESIWVNEEEQTATVAVVIHTNQGLTQTQINALYHLISKSVPKLPLENISIMDQNMQALDFSNENEVLGTLAQYQQQRQIKRDIERDIQRQLQQMLGRILGNQKVVVSVFADVDFTVETREEHRIEGPVENEDGVREGIAISVERIVKSFEGEGSSAADGIPGTGEQDIAGYPAASSGTQNSEYEELEERINRDVDRIFKQIETSPYLIKDLTINVAVDREHDPNDPVINEIRTILKQVVATSIPKDVLPDVTQDPQGRENILNDKITVLEYQFETNKPITFLDEYGTPLLYALAAIVVLAIGGVTYSIIRRRRIETEREEEISFIETTDFDFTDESEEAEKRRRIERLAKNKPEEFVKLLRTWLAED